MSDPLKPSAAEVTEADRKNAQWAACPNCGFRPGCNPTCIHVNEVAQDRADARAAEGERAGQAHRAMLRQVIGKPVGTATRITRSGDITCVTEEDYARLRLIYNRIWEWAYQDVEPPPSGDGEGKT